MTRSDLEALARAIIARADHAASERQGPRAAIIVNQGDLAGFFEEVAPLVAAHERAKTIAAIRAKATEYVSVPIGPYHVAAALLRDLADDLEDDK